MTPFLGFFDEYIFIYFFILFMSLLINLMHPCWKAWK